MTCEDLLSSRRHHQVIIYWSPSNCSARLSHLERQGRPVSKGCPARSPWQAALAPLAPVFILHLYVESQEAEVPTRNHESLMTP